MPLTRIDSAFLDLDALGGIDFDVQSGVPTLKVDAVNHRIGIGNNSPAQKLDVTGNINVSSGSNYLVDGSQISTANIAENASYLYFTDARASSAITGSALDMGSNNITTTGKVLFANMYSAIGDLPSASTYHGMFAHVHGTGKGYFAHGGNWIRLLDESGGDVSGSFDITTTSGARALTINAPTLGPYIAFETGGTAFADIGSEAGLIGSGSNTDTLTLNARGARALSFRTNSNERLRITSGGLIGVNVTPTQQKLTIDVDNSGTTQASFDGINICNTDGTTNNGAAIVFGQAIAGNSYARIGVINTDRSSGSEDQEIFFATLGAGSYAERLRITSTGELVSTNGTLRRNVNDSSFTVGGGTASNAGANINLYGATHSSLASIFRVRNGSTETFRITSDGLIHLGNSGHGDTKVGGQSITGQDTSATLKLYDTRANMWGMQMRRDTNTGPNGIFVRAGNSSSNYSLFVCGTNESVTHLACRGDGKVGIGTANPTDHLEILHTNGKGLTFKTTENHSAQITADCNRSAADNTILAIRGNWNGVAAAEIALTTGDDTANKDDGKISFKTASSGGNVSQRMQINRLGNILINTGDNTFNSRSGFFNDNGGSDPAVQIEGSIYAYSSMSITRNGSGASGAAFILAKGRGGTTIINDNDMMGQISFQGAEGGGDMVEGAKIIAEVDGTPASSNMPGRLSFYTNPGTSALTSSHERLRIAADGKVYFGDFASAGAKSYILKETNGEYKFNIFASASTTDNRVITVNSRSNVEALRISSNATPRVGINTTGPNALLTVGPVDSPTFYRGTAAIKATNDDNSIDTCLYLEEASGAEGWQLSVASNGELNFHNSGASTSTLKLGDDDLVTAKALHVTHNITPASGRGVEIFEAATGVGQISSFNRTGNSWDELRIKGSEVGIYTGTSNSLGFYLQSTQSTLYGTSDGVLNLDSSDGAGAFMRFKHNGTSKGWAGCSEGIGTGGDQDDFGIRAVGNIRLRASARTLAKFLTSGAVTFHVNSDDHETFRFTTEGVDEAKLIMRDASDNNDIILNTGGDSYFRGGNVGIGHVSPDCLLHIRKDSTDTNFTNETTPSTESGMKIANLSTTVGSWTALTLSVSDGSTTQNGSIITKSVSGGTRPEIHITQRNGNATESKITIDSSGKVGISDSNPSRTLSVSGSMNLASGSRIESYSSTGNLIIQGGSTYPGGHIHMYGGSGDNKICFNTTGASTTVREMARVNGEALRTGGGTGTSNNGYVPLVFTSQNMLNGYRHGTSTRFIGQISPCNVGNAYLHVKIDIPGSPMFWIHSWGYMYGQASFHNSQGVGYFYNNALINTTTSDMNSNYPLHIYRTSDSELGLRIYTGHGVSNAWGFHAFEGGFDGINGNHTEHAMRILAWTWSSSSSNQY